MNTLLRRFPQGMLKNIDTDMNFSQDVGQLLSPKISEEENQRGFSGVTVILQMYVCLHVQ